MPARGGAGGLQPAAGGAGLRAVTQPSGIAFFDVDRTVLRRSSGRYFLLLGVRQGLFPLTSLIHLQIAYLNRLCEFPLETLVDRKVLPDNPFLSPANEPHFANDQISLPDR